MCKEGAGRTDSPWVVVDRGSAWSSRLFPARRPERLKGRGGPHTRPGSRQGECRREAVVTDVFVGIDVSKDWLDVAVRDGGAWRVRNEPEAHQALAFQLAALKPALVVLEATGAWSQPVARALATKMPVAVVNPRRVRQYAQATGLLAKTDRLMRECSRVSPKQ